LAQPLDNGAFEALGKLWRTADQRIKRSERLQTILSLPAVKEIRDAGYHLLLAIEAIDRKTELEELNRASRHVIRASYDAVESEVLYLLERIRLFKSDYRMIEIKVDGLDYQGIRKRAREAKRLIIDAQCDRETRDQHYARLLSHCDQLSSDLDQLDDSRDELNKKLRGTRWRIVAAVLGILVAAFAACGTWMNGCARTSLSPPAPQIFVPTDTAPKDR
jgi:hypothetical protein